jgi:hypothetical protein
VALRNDPPSNSQKQHCGVVVAAVRGRRRMPAQVGTPVRGSLLLLLMAQQEVTECPRTGPSPPPRAHHGPLPCAKKKEAL